ncbi:MAG: hypothetical protein AAB638_02330 [Patescibacteria group bacterium]
MTRLRIIPSVPPAVQHNTGLHRAEKEFQPHASEVFQLTMVSPPITGASLPGLTGIFGWSSLRFTGQEFSGPPIQSFKLVWPGRFKTLEELSSALRGYGHIPEGIWIYPYLMARGGIRAEKLTSIADPSWLSPESFCFIPIINTKGELDFYFSKLGFGINRAWLVRVD